MDIKISYSLQDGIVEIIPDEKSSDYIESQSELDCIEKYFISRIPDYKRDFVMDAKLINNQLILTLDEKSSDTPVYSKLTPDLIDIAADSLNEDTDFMYTQKFYNSCTPGMILED